MEIESPALLTTPFDFDNEMKLPIMQEILAKQEPLTPETVEEVISKLEKVSSSDKPYKGIGFSGIELMKIADEYPWHVKSVLQTIMRRRNLFPGYNMEPGFYRLDQFASLLRWYERKSAHRTFMYQYAGNLDTMSIEAFQQYITNEIMPNIPRLSKDLYKTAYNLICMEAAVMCCSSSVMGKLSIKRLISSTILDEIDESIGTSGIEYDKGPFNWFSVQNVFVILNDYRQLDVERKGMLSFDNICKLGNLNIIFLEGFWQSPKCYKFSREVEIDGATKTLVETDLSGLVCLERLLFNLATIQDNNRINCVMEYDYILHYVFRCLSEGWDDHWTLKHFSRIVRCLFDELKTMDSENDITFADMFSILINFINSKNTDIIYFSDVMNLDKNIRPGSFSQSALFLGMLIDARKFRNYDNRENI